MSQGKTLAERRDRRRRYRQSRARRDPQFAARLRAKREAWEQRCAERAQGETSNGR